VYGKYLQIEREDGVATLRLDRPPVNAIDNDLLDEASAELARLEAQSEVRALVVTGAGACFSAGLDLKLIPRYSAEQQQRAMRGINELVARLYALPLPTVAAINGHAIAGGLVIALGCDYRVATTGVCQIGLTEARAGIPFPAVAMAVVRAELTPAVARRLTLLAHTAGPEAALADGIVDELAAPDQLIARASAVARELGAIPRDAYARIKHQLRADAIAANRTVLERGDPLAKSWLSRDVTSAAAALLERKSD
jgi:enoyl-CoA hydratase